MQRDTRNIKEGHAIKCKVGINVLAPLLYTVECKILCLKLNKTENLGELAAEMKTFKMIDTFYIEVDTPYDFSLLLIAMTSLKFTKLHIKCEGFGEEMLKGLASFLMNNTNIQTLSISTTRHSNKHHLNMVLRSLYTLPNLSSFTYIHDAIDVETMFAISSISQIKHLSMEHCRFVITPIQFLVYINFMTDLRSITLSVDNNSVSSVCAVFEEIKIPHLSSIELRCDSELSPDNCDRIAILALNLAQRYPTLQFMTFGHDYPRVELLDQFNKLLLTHDYLRSIKFKPKDTHKDSLGYIQAVETMETLLSVNVSYTSELGMILKEQTEKNTIMPCIPTFDDIYALVFLEREDIRVQKVFSVLHDQKNNIYMSSYNLNVSSEKTVFGSIRVEDIKQKRKSIIPLVKL